MPNENLESNIEKQSIKIWLGSTSVHKREALQSASEKIGIKIETGEFSAESGINAQPYGLEETHLGAFNRAKQAQEQNPQALALGIENGIIPVDNKFIDMAVVVVLMPGGREFVGTSAGVEFPKEAVEVARAKGFDTTTVGSIIAETMGGSGTDPQSTLTGGKVTRKEILTEAIVAVLSQALLS